MQSTGLHNKRITISDYTAAGFKSNAKSRKFNLLTCEEGTLDVSDKECGI